MADVDAAFVQQILHVPKRKRKPNIHHGGQTDDLGARLKVAKGAVFCHPATLIARPARLNQFCSDSASQTNKYNPAATDLIKRSKVTGSPSDDIAKQLIVAVPS